METLYETIYQVFDKERDRCASEELLVIKIVLTVIIRQLKEDKEISPERVAEILEDLV